MTLQYNIEKFRGLHPKVDTNLNRSHKETEKYFFYNNPQNNVQTLALFLIDNCVSKSIKRTVKKAYFHNYIAKRKKEEECCFKKYSKMFKKPKKLGRVKLKELLVLTQHGELYWKPTKVQHLHRVKKYQENLLGLFGSIEVDDIAVERWQKVKIKWFN